MSSLIGSDWYYRALCLIKETGQMRTYQMALKLQIKTSQALRLLKQMETEGVVKKAAFSYSNCYSWELRKEQEK